MCKGYNYFLRLGIQHPFKLHMTVLTKLIIDVVSRRFQGPSPVLRGALTGSQRSHAPRRAVAKTLLISKRGSLHTAKYCIVLFYFSFSTVNSIIYIHKLLGIISSVTTRREKCKRLRVVCYWLGNNFHGKFAFTTYFVLLHV